MGLELACLLLVLELAGCTLHAAIAPFESTIQVLHMLDYSRISYSAVEASAQQ